MKAIEGLTLERYELRRRVAQGGMAEVYLAYDRRAQRQVAIKVLYGRDESFVRRFEREVQAVGTLSHDHILSLYDFGEQHPWYYLVMPYVEGGTLRDYLLKRKQLTLEEAASFIEQIASALQYAHNHGVIHRDVKPSNILLRRDGFAYLVDFGLAKAMSGAESLTCAGAMVGTPEYMAPEQSNGLHDYRSDIYSLGVILYQMLTGRVPFMADSPVAISLKHIQIEPTPPRTLNSEIPASVEEVILKAMAKDPNERYQEAQALSVAYRKALQQGQIGSTGDELAPSTPPIAADETHSENERPWEAVCLSKRLGTFVPQTGHPQGDAPTIHASSCDGASWYSRGIPLAGALVRVVALICLLALLFVVPFGLSGQSQSPMQAQLKQSTQAASGQQTGLTATAATQARQAQAQATLAAQSRVQGTAGITSSIGAGTVLYADSLTNSDRGIQTTTSGGWVDDASQCSFKPGGYHVQTYAAHTAAWCYSNQQLFANVVITAQAQLLRGDNYGLIFRLSPRSRAFYVLEINSAGNYRFVRATGNDPSQWLTLIDWTHSNAILSGYGSTNTFLVIATGSHFRFYMNRQLIVTSFSDTTYSSGFLGFLVSGDSPNGTEAAFSNMWVFQK